LRISIIIPSRNQAEYLEATLRSVVEQSYRDTEIILIDGGSTDGTVDLIRRHAAHLAYWVSEPDHGQADAINKGLARMTGEVWMYLNSDDLLLPGALARIAAAFDDPAVMWVGGAADVFDQTGAIGEIIPRLPDNKRDYLSPWRRAHKYVFPFSGACFMRGKIYQAIGPFDPALHYSMDIEYYLRAHFRGGFRQTLVPHKLAAWRWHAHSKTMLEGLAYGFREDEIRLAERFRADLSTDDQVALTRELRFERKQLVARKAAFMVHSRRRGKALALLLKGICTWPSLLWFRPWLGQMRRLLVTAPR
jgi:glycosyltransferase involved in cell wall biosynthesis